MLAVVGSDIKTPAAAPDPASVLSHAVVRVAEELAISQTVLAKTLGLSTATTSRLVAGRYVLAANGKSWDLARLLVRVFRSLDSIVGNQADARTWLHNHNHALGDKPIALLPQVEGLVRVLQYLDASRGLI